MVATKLQQNKAKKNCFCFYYTFVEEESWRQQKKRIQILRFSLFAEPYIQYATESFLPFLFGG